MPHIQLPAELPGIRALLAYRPETAKPLSELADALLQAPGTLTPGEREMIAAYVSRLNQCTFCHNSHAAIAAAHLEDEDLVTAVMTNPDGAEITPKLKALLAVAAKVQQGGRAVHAADIDRARQAGATDVEIHDAVLIAAAFCMYNRYVDGLATWAPEEKEHYRESGRFIAKSGYSAAQRMRAEAASTNR